MNILAREGFLGSRFHTEATQGVFFPAQDKRAQK